MSRAHAAFAALLPTRVQRAEFQDPTLLIGGDSWSLTATCAWRCVDGKDRVVSLAVNAVADDVWSLAGLEILKATWSGPSGLGVDPSFDPGAHGSLHLFSDAAFDTPVLRTPGLVPVGPLREE